MTPSLDPFPDLCLIAIFINLPLSDLLAVVGLVCSRWRGLLPTVLARRHTLKIAHLAVGRVEHDHLYGTNELIYQVRRDDGSPWVVRTKVDTRNVVVVPNASPRMLTEPFADGLMDSLPNITSLTVVCGQNLAQNLLPQLFTQITRMLNHWQDSLVTLNLSIRFDFDRRAHGNIDFTARNLLESINRLRSLRHLKIDCNFPSRNFEPELSIFAQLFTFKYSDLFACDWIINSMQQYTNPDVIRQITVNSIADMRKLILLTPRLASKFTMANCCFTPIEGTLDTVKTLCTRFTSVRYLRIKLSGHILHTISPNLAQLQHLVHLGLTLTPPFHTGPPELTPMNSVRMLTINLSMFNPNYSHPNLETWLPQLFPNVQVLQMKHHSYVCRDCDYDSRMFIIDHHPEVWPKIHECKRMVRQALTILPNLHTIRLEQCPGTSDGTLTQSDIFDSLEQL